MRLSSLAVESNDGTGGGSRVLAEKNHADYHVYKMKYYDECVCMSVSCLYITMSACWHISKSTRPNFKTFSVFVNCGRGLVL